jgi:hypothetical protein
MIKVSSVVLFVVAGLLLLGCAGGNYGTIRPEDSGRVTLDTLLCEWKNYNIYYGGTNPDRPIALLFDVEVDENTIRMVTF